MTVPVTLCLLCGRKWKYKLIDSKWVEHSCVIVKSNADETLWVETL